MVIRSCDVDRGDVCMTKTIYINATLTDSELKALVSHVEALEELERTHINHFETFNHEIDEMYEASTKSWTVSVKMR